MTGPPNLDATLRRLTAALDQLDAAAESRTQADAAHADRDEEFALLQRDRSRLALELDSSLTRCHSLDLATQEAVRRLARAEAGILAALGAAPGGEEG